MSEDDQFETIDDVDDELEKLAHAVRWCLANRESLGQTLRRLREEHLRGEAIQSDLSAVLQRCPNLLRICYVAWRFEITSAIEAAVSRDILEAEAGEQFLLWWGEQRWVTEGFEAHLRSEVEGENPSWTGTSLTFRVTDGQLRVRHTMKRGTDEVNSVDVPAVKLFDEAVWQVDGIVAHLANANEQGNVELEENLIKVLHQRLDTLERVVEQINELVGSVDMAVEEVSEDDPNKGESALEDLFVHAQDVGDANVDGDDTMHGFH